MLILWDEPKHQVNLAKHHLDFAELDANFFLHAVVVPARVGRFQAIGRFNGALIAVIFSRLGSEALSVISMRSAGVRERRLFDEHQT
jgi:uncharacterized DUF497 family protein